MPSSSNSDTLTVNSQWPRVGCLRLRPPQRDTGSFRDSHPLSSVIREAFNNTDVRRIELLSWPDEPHQEWILHPISASPPSHTDEDKGLNPPAQQTLDGRGTPTSASDAEPSSALGAIENASDDYLVKPHGYGYDRCAVDLSPIEGTIRPTCRLAVRESPDLVPLSVRNPHPTVQLISDLSEEDIPYLLQTIISRGGSNSDFELSQRLAIYPPQYGLAVEHDFAAHLDGGPKIDLSSYYDDQSNRIRSNFDLDATRYFKIDKSADQWTVTPRHKHNIEIIRAARRVLAGRKECHDLYAGYHDTDKELENLYQYANYYTKIPVDSSTLRAFIALVVESVSYSPWGTVGYVDPPQLITTPIVLPEGADTDDHDTSTSSEHVVQCDDTQSPSLATRGSDEHQFNEGLVKSYYSDRGWTVEQLDTDVTGSVPDLRIQKDDQTYFVEVEQTNESKPANVLTNAGRAAHHDMDVIFVGEDKSTVQSLAKILRHPVSEAVTDGARLYNQSSELILEDGSKPLLPEGVDESRWYLRYPTEPHDAVDEQARSPAQVDPELRLETPDGDVIVSGSPAESVAAWTEYPDTVAQSVSVPDDRTQIRPPFVPTQLAYLHRSSLQYLDGDQLEPLEPDEFPTSWNQSDAAGKRERYENAYGEFVTRYTVSIPHTEIEKSAFIQLINNGVYEPQTSRKAPGDRESGRALWTHAERKSRENNTLHLIKNRTWRWPRHITSPDLPFVGEPAAVLEDSSEETDP